MKKKRTLRQENDRLSCLISLACLYFIRIQKYQKKDDYITKMCAEALKELGFYDSDQQIESCDIQRDT